MTESFAGSVVSANELAAILHLPVHKRVILDCRSFLDFNVNHIISSVNVGCSKLLKRRLQNDKMSLTEFLTQNFNVEVNVEFDIFVYDQSTCDAVDLPADSCFAVLLAKLTRISKSVCLLRGGFSEFESLHPELCVNRPKSGVAMGDDSFYHHPQHHSISQPCLPVANIGPTKVLPFLFLGSQVDALCLDTMTKNGIAYVLNVSPLGQKPEFIQDGHFLRIPVNDNYSDRLLPFFRDAFQFLDKVREANGCVLVHCLAGVSRSPTVVIAYVMRTLKMSMDDAYRYVKEKRPSISPNFNFLGQLLEYQKQQKEKSEDCEEIAAKKMCLGTNVSSPVLDFNNYQSSTSSSASFLSPFVSSPTNAFARLSFGQLSPLKEQSSPPLCPAVATDSGIPSFVPSTLRRGAKPDTSFNTLKGSASRRPFSSHELHLHKTSSHAVTLHAKRPHPRPNSIAFLPLREIQSPTNICDSNPTDVAFQAKNQTDEEPSSLIVGSVFSNQAAIASPTCVPFSADSPRFDKNALDDVGVEGCDGSPKADCDFEPKWRKRKSRSLEDILSITYEVTMTTGKKKTRRNHGDYMANILVSPVTFDLKDPFFLDCRSSSTGMVHNLAVSDTKPDRFDMISVS